MSEAEAVKALREWCGLPPCDWIISVGVRRRNDGTHDHEAGRALQRLIESAPALLARIEAGEGLLREARDAMKPFAEILGEEDSGDYDDRWAGTIIGDPKHGDESFVKIDTHLRELRAYDAARAKIDAFLAAKEADRG